MEPKVCLTFSRASPGDDVPDDHQNGVVRRIPLIVKPAERRRRSFYQTRAASPARHGRGRALEHRLEQPHVKYVFGIGEVLGDFLFDGAAFLSPQLFVLCEQPRIRAASIRNARSRSLAGTVKKYCVTDCGVSALNSPPRAADMSANWSAERPGCRETSCVRGHGRFPGTFGRFVGAHLA